VLCCSGIADRFGRRTTGDEKSTVPWLLRGYHGGMSSCRRHLKNNAIHYAQDVVRMSCTERTAFVDAIFGDGGLASSAVVAVFDSNVERLRAELLADVPMQLRTFCDNRL